MPKEKVNKAAHLRKIVDEFGENIFSTDGKILFCKICEVRVAAEKKFTVQQHITRNKHQCGLQLKAKNKKRQSLLIESASKGTDTYSEFSKELCEAFASANIPLKKLNNPKLKCFLEKYMQRSIPDESTIRKNFLPRCFDEVLTKIRQTVEGKKIFVSIDETCDAENRNVANVIVGTMESSAPGPVFLLNSQVLEKVNNSSICKLFNEAMMLLWPDGIQYDDVLVFASDAAPYMIKAGKSIQEFYPKVIHVTCLAHGLHRVAEKIRCQFSAVDALIANTKKVFIKAPLRRERFTTLAPNIPFPPEPILTRWGTWLSACIYYCQHFENVKIVIDSFESHGSQAIKDARILFSNEELKGQLAYIKTNFECLVSALDVMQTKGYPLQSGITVIADLKKKNKC